MNLADPSAWIIVLCAFVAGLLVGTVVAVWRILEQLVQDDDA